MELHEFNRILHPRRRTAGPDAGDVCEAVGRLVGGDPAGLVCTSSGAEALNLAVKGIAWAARGRTRLVRSPLEEGPARDAARFLTGRGFVETVLPVDADGGLDPATVDAALGDDVALLAVTAASSEIGALPPLVACGEIAARHGIPLVVDATAAAGRIALDADAWHAAAVAVSGRRVGGPAGTGALWLRPGTRIVPLIHGGLEENGLRAGAHDPDALAAFASACRAARMEAETTAPPRIAAAERLLAGLLALDDVTRTGPAAPRLPGHASVLVDGVDGEALVLDVERRGFRFATGSPCSRAGRLSPVLAALGHAPRGARGSLVAVLDADGDDATIDAAVRAVAAAAGRLRALAPGDPV